MALDQDQLEKPFRKLRKALKNLPDEPSPEDVHHLRTRIRRIEATMQALKLDGTHEGRRLLKSVASIRKRAGQVRDMDVLTSFASTLNNDSDSECQVQLLEHLGVQRFRAAQKLHSSIAEQRDEARERMKDHSALIRRSFRKSKDGLSKHEWPANATAVALRLSSELTEWPPLKPDNLHPFRLKVKELRYILQMADDRDDRFVSTLGKVKDTIGEWHDWTELAAIATEAVDHGHACDLIKQIRSTTDAKLDRALSLAARMRRRYLGVGTKAKSGPRAKPARIKDAAVSTAARLAA